MLRKDIIDIKPYLENYVLKKDNNIEDELDFNKIIPIKEEGNISYSLAKKY